MSIELQHIKKTYENGEEVLTDINAIIEDGQFYILVGASGSGKSTILNAVAGFLTIDSGQVIINHQDVTTLPPKNRHLSMVFQNYALMPNLTVSENIIFGLSARHVSKEIKAQKLREALSLVHLEDYQDKRPGSLSGGQRQRVSLARALVSEAKIVLMDEPLSNLDAKLRAEMRKEIRTLQQQLGLTVIYVTHDQTEAMTMGDQVMLLNQGKIEQIGAPLELYNHPANTFVADFFGSPAINLLAVEINQNRLTLSNGITVPLNSPIKSGSYQIGIRPENVIITPTGRFSGEITQIEPLGDGTNIAIDMKLPDLIRIKLNEQTTHQLGDSVAFDLLNAKAMIFNSDGQLIDIGKESLMVG